MKIIHIENRKRVLKTDEEMEEEISRCSNKMNRMLISHYKFVPTDEPIYIVEMSIEEYQLISFYLELEKRKPIMNVKLDTKIKEVLNEKEST